MQIVKITTSQNIEIDYEVAGLGERILGRLIDYALFLIIFIAVIVSLSVTRINNIFSDLTAGILILVVFLTYLFYDLLFEVFYNGQSVGKKIMKIRVISLDGARPTLGQYCLRWIFRIVDFSLTGHLGALISVAVSDKKQRIGDIVAGTTLIKTSPRTGIEQIAFVPTAQNYEAVFPEAALLSDQDILIIHEVTSHFRKTDDYTVLYAAAQKTKEHLGIKDTKGLNHLQFLETIVKDFNNLAHKADQEAR